MENKIVKQIRKISSKYNNDKIMKICLYGDKIEIIGID